jgi:hypothetical protein
MFKALTFEHFSNLVLLCILVLSVGFSACITPSSSALIPRISTLTVNFSSNLESERNKMHMFYPSGNDYWNVQRLVPRFIIELDYWNVQRLVPRFII